MRSLAFDPLHNRCYYGTPDDGAFGEFGTVSFSGSTGALINHASTFHAQQFLSFNLDDIAPKSGAGGTKVPEPGSLALVGLALAGASRLHRRKTHWRERAHRACPNGASGRRFSCAAAQWKSTHCPSSRIVILEIADIRIHPGQQLAFEAAIQHGIATVVSRAKGFMGFKVNRGVESPDRFVLQIFWETLEDHTVGFRQGPLFTQWRGIVGPFFAVPPAVEHFTLVARSE